MDDHSDIYERTTGENWRKIENLSEEKPVHKVSIRDFNARTGHGGESTDEINNKDFTKKSEDNNIDKEGQGMIQNIRNLGMEIFNGKQQIR